MDSDKVRLFFKGFVRDPQGFLLPDYSTLVGDSKAWTDKKEAKEFLQTHMDDGSFYCLDGWPALEVFHVSFSNCQVCNKEITSADTYFKEGYCSSLCKLEAISIEESFYDTLEDIHSVLQRNATRSFLR